jgi:hypothetical protein
VPLYVVHTPPQKTRADAERLAAELRKRGATDATVLGDDSPLKLTVALGAFREADGAKRYVGELEQRGIKGARVADKPIPQPMTRYQIRGVDAALAERLQAIQKELPASRLGPCGSLDAAPRGP